MFLPLFKLNQLSDGLDVSSQRSSTILNAYPGALSEVKGIVKKTCPSL